MSPKFLAVIDPAWAADAGGGGRGAQNHYALDPVVDLALGYILDERWPKRDTDVDALVFMWATAGAMATGDAHALARELSLRVCAGFVWAKVDGAQGWRDASCTHSMWRVSPVGINTEIDRKYMAVERDALVDAFRAPSRLGLGQWSRCEHEHLLVCRRGDVKVPETSSRPRSMIYAPRGKHSAKPERAWTQVIEPIARSSMPGVLGVEFNARTRRRGWAAVGRLDGEDKPIRFESPALEETPAMTPAHQ